MTERLRELLHGEANDLAVPTPKVAATLAEGHAMVRRRRIRTGLAAGAVACVVAVAGTIVAAQLDEPASDQEYAAPRGASETYRTEGAWARGSVVHIGMGGGIDIGEPIKALYYTSAGVVVRFGANPYADGSRSSYALVTPAGELERLDVELGDVSPDTDPAAPYLAWTEPADSGWEVVVLDVAAAGEVARVPVSGAFTWGGWDAPPVALVGETAYVALDDATLAVDWSSGASEEVVSLPGKSFPDVAGAIGIRVTESQVQAVDLTTGADVVSVLQDEQTWPWMTLSPDGRFALVRTDAFTVTQGSAEGSSDGQELEQLEDDLEVLAGAEDSSEPSMMEGTSMTRGVVHDLSTGETAEFEVGTAEFGWSPDGHLLRVVDGQLSVCTPVPLECGEATSVAGSGELRLGGTSYES